MKKIAILASAVAVCLMATAAQAATVTFGGHTTRAVSTAEGTGGAPSGGSVNSYFVTTDADILSIGFVQITAPNLYNNALGSNSGPAADAIIAAFPAAGADTYIDTPGATAILGVDLPGDGTANSAWGDTSDDGPRQNFKFAQITVPQGTGGVFRGQLTVAGATGPESFNFELPIPVPEPTSVGLASMGLLALAGLRRRFA
jgi:hypothetical protein